MGIRALSLKCVFNASLVNLRIHVYEKTRCNINEEVGRKEDFKSSVKS